MTPTPSVADLPRGRTSATFLEMVVFVSSIAFQQLAAVPEDASAWWSVGIGAFVTLLAVGAARAMPLGGSLPVWRTRLRRGLLIGATAALPALGTLAAVPLVGATPRPEAFLLAVTAGAVLVLLAGQSDADQYRFALAASAFLVVLSTIVVAHPAAPFLQTVYAGAAACWLAARRDARADAGSHSAPPFRASLLIPCLAVAVVVAAGSGAIGNAARAVAGFMPFSGGDSWNDPWASDGIGDGENLVAGQHDATSSGPVDSAIFLESERPSLYDLWNEQFGEPPRAKEKRERAVPLDLSEVRGSEGRTADSDHAGREFSTVRTGRQRSDKPPDIRARTLLTVDGPTPILLRLDAFDRFDGRTWSSRSDRDLDPAQHLEMLRDDWVRVGPASDTWAADAPERHTVTIGTLESPVLPVPTVTERLRIPRISDLSMYRLADDELLALNRSSVPPATKVSVVSRPFGIDGRDPEPVLPVGPALIRPGETSIPGVAERAWLDALLREWRIGKSATGTSNDWKTVAAIVARIRRHAVLDPAVVAPLGAPDTVEHFLTGSRRGPAYQFAGSSAVILRHLGFRTRLASGFEVSGQRCDPRSRRVIAAAEDVHVWAEIQDASGRWIPLEATPGHWLRGSELSFARLVVRALRRLLPTTPDAAVRLAVLVVSVAGVAALASWRWRRWADGVVTSLWRFEMERTSVCPLETTWRLVERRGWIAGRPRPAHETVRRWYLPPCDPIEGGAHPTEGFIRAFEAVSYGRPDSCRDRDGHRLIALAAERSWTLDALLGRSSIGAVGIERFMPRWSLPRRMPT